MGDNNDYITIVSGLPRSGTSMMMKMLDAANLPLLIDNIRQSDIDNPKGYYEFEKVKELEKDNSWLGQARSKVVKIVSPLLQYLDMDPKYQYKIIFMVRNLNEVFASQKKMSDRLNDESDTSNDDALRQHYIKHLEEIENWLESHDNVDAIYVKYTDVLSEPLMAAEGICEFLSLDADPEKVASVIDSSLYRNRSDESDEPAEAASSSESEEDQEAIMDRLKQLGYL